MDRSRPGWWGPDGGDLTIDVARVGADHPASVLVVLSGVHGVEGFAEPLIRADLLERIDGATLGSSAVVLVHAVNPYGMAWWRRQNESNVDLNRNWDRSSVVVVPENPAYDEVHDLLCPTGTQPPAAEPFLTALRGLVDERGGDWVKAAISQGQYRHADGLYFGGERTEMSPQLVDDIVRRHAAGAELVVTVDLHTGHGTRGTYTILSDAAMRSVQVRPR